MFRSSRRARAGFNLVELMFVVAICGVVVSIAVPYIASLIDKARARAELSVVTDAMCKEFRAATDEDFRFSGWVGDTESIPLVTGGEISAKGLISSDGSRVTASSPRGEMACEYRVAQEDEALVVVGRCDLDHDLTYMVAAQFCNVTCTSDGPLVPVAGTMDIGLTDDQIAAWIDLPLAADKLKPCSIKAALQAASLTSPGDGTAS